MSEEQTKHRIVVRCKTSGKKLARRDEKGVYLFCKECGAEEFFTWEELGLTAASSTAN